MRPARSLAAGFAGTDRLHQLCSSGLAPACQCPSISRSSVPSISPPADADALHQKLGHCQRSGCWTAPLDRAAFAAFSREGKCLRPGADGCNHSSDAWRCPPGTLRPGSCGGGRAQDALALFFTEGGVDEPCSPYRVAPGRDSDGPAVGGAEEASSFEVPDRFELRESDFGACRRARACLSQAGALHCDKLYGRSPSIEEAAPGAAGGSLQQVVGYLQGPLAMQAAILAYGAVVSVVEVYADFLGYTGTTGVYRRARTLGPHDCLGLMAVQLLGWGSDTELRPYWLGEAGFGEVWGRAGLFWWARGEDHLGIERRALRPFVDGLFPDGLGANSTRSSRRVPWEDELSALIERRGSALGSVDDLQLTNGYLLAANAGGVAVAVLAVALGCVYQHLEWPFDAPDLDLSQPAPMSARELQRGRWPGHRYAAVSSG